MKDNNNELLPVVDEFGKVIGKATRGECHFGTKLLHPIVYLHVFDSDDRIFLQKRPMWKEIEPGKWDVAVGGHVDFGEKITDALFREAKEELGLTDFIPENLGTHIFETNREKEFVNSFKTVVKPDDIHLSDEVDGGRWWSINELRESSDILTPNLRYELEFVLGVSEC